MPLMSVIVPCHNEEESLPIFTRALNEVACRIHAEYEELAVELIVIDDGSTDLTFPVARGLADTGWTHLDIRWTSFSRNFGKEAGIYAGLKMARGDYIAIMDADMQDPPELLPKMLHILMQNDSYDCVATRRTTRKGEPPVRSFFARMFYRVINRISQTEFVDGARDFRLMRRRMVDAVLSVGEYNRFSKGIFSWVGFETYWLGYENVERVAGKTNWNFWGLMKYSIDGIVGFSTAPLAFASVAGALFSLIALVFLVVVVVRALFFGDPVSGWPSTMSVMLLLGGLNLLVLGIMGQYLGKTYLETKARPLYIVKETSDSTLVSKQEASVESNHAPYSDNHLE